MKKAIVVGASSGIGSAVALELMQSGYVVGITGRREKALEHLKASKPDAFVVSAFDNTEPGLIERLDKLLAILTGLDILVISSGTGELNSNLDFNLESPTIDLNIRAFTEVADWAYNYFKDQGSGHLAAISSIGGLRGGRHAPAYNASKAYQINYLEGLRQKSTFEKSNITITDIRPGFVDTAMAKGESFFWMASPKKAASQIMNILKKKKSVGYVTKRWVVFALLLKLIPRTLYQKL